MRAWGCVVLLACAGSEPSSPVDTDAAGSDTGSPAPTARIEPARAWTTSGPLRCVAEGRVSWLVDGAPAADVDGAEVPAERLRPGQTWTCLAASGGRVAVDTRRVDPPNVVLVLADDLGWGDVGFLGGGPLTPRLDGLAAQGVAFPRAYAAAPVCGPSRAGLLTGRQPARIGFEYNVGDGGDPVNGIPAGERLLPELLRDAGLVTGLFGKWHLGVQPEHHPSARGFDRFFGFLDGRRPALDPRDPAVHQVFVEPFEVESWPLSGSGQPLLDGDAPAAIDGRHLTDRLVDEAIAFVDQHRSEPFFAMVSLQSPHIPLLATDAWLAAVPDPGDGTQHVLDANVRGLDEAIGRLVDALGELDPHTVVVVTSDNGCPAGPVPCSNGPLRGGKLTLQEGGLRVPTLIRWPGEVAGARVEAATISQLDLLPTLLAAVGGTPPRAPLDGVDLGPLLRGQAVGEVHDRLYWRMLPARGVLAGDVKVVQLWDRTWRYDLAADPYEEVDLHANGPDGSTEAIGWLEGRSEVLRQALWLGEWAPTVYYGEEAVIMF